MSSLVNLTLHPIRIYLPSTPDRVGDEHAPCRIIYPSGDYPPARLAGIDLGTQYYGVGVPVELVEFSGVNNGLVHPLPPAHEGTWYIVPLIVALKLTYMADGRDDLLAPYGEVRNAEGTVVGCRLLARPV